MAATDSPLFPRDLGKEIGVAWLRPLPTSLGTFRAGPGKTSGSIVNSVSPSSHSSSLSLEGQAPSSPPPTAPNERPLSSSKSVSLPLVTKSIEK